VADVANRRPARAGARAREQAFSATHMHGPRQPHEPVVILAGGTGGAKLARGMLDLMGHEQLVVIANTGDDIELYGAHVSPDPDLVCFWLADLIDERGWGLRGDTFAVMDALRNLGREIWFNLGDRDLAWCLERARMLAEGLTPTAALARLRRAIGLEVAVLPMCDGPVRTWIRSSGRWRAFQEFMVRERAAGPIEGVELRGIASARPSREVLAVLASARAVVIGPSNPLVSIDPILSVPGMREAIAAARAPVVAVSPIVGGRILKGPTAAFMSFAGHELSAAGIVAHYRGLLDGIVSDERPSAGEHVAALTAETLMDDEGSRMRLAAEVLEFASSLSAEAR
jgi:LPPG:FO 2-phospho-L-lactate transferase